MRLIPMKFRQSDASIRKANSSDSLYFTSAASSVVSSQPLEIMYSSPRHDSLDDGNVTDNLKIHGEIIVILPDL